ncbi:MAG: COG4223 family protein [Methyloceanibacter sp.]|uniref:COG4223 family protein n=1 Tax=Methyloceanibacter sp. TaxID=1965321 RepID=UPI003D9AD185
MDPVRADEDVAAETQSHDPHVEEEKPGPNVRTVSPQTSGSDLKSFATHLAAGLLGGLIAVIGLPLFWDVGGKTTPPDLSALETRVAKLETAPPQDAAQSERVTRLEDALKTMAETAKEEGSVADAAAVSQQIHEAEARLQARIAGAPGSGGTADAEAVRQIQTEIAALQSKVAALGNAPSRDQSSAPEIMALSERVVALEAAVPNLVGAIDKEMHGTRSAALALAFSNLRAAVNEGRPYVTELSTIRALAPGAADLGMLSDHAEKGIPTLPELVRSFRATKEDLLAAEDRPADGSFLGSLMTSAQSLVKIRRVDDNPTGNAPSDVLARAEAALDRGQLAEAVAEVDTLKGDAGENFAAWRKATRARLSVDETLKQLEGVLLASLAGGGAPAQP